MLRYLVRHLEQGSVLLSDMALMDLLEETVVHEVVMQLCEVPTIGAVVENYRELRLTINKWT